MDRIRRRDWMALCTAAGLTLQLHSKQSLFGAEETSSGLDLAKLRSVVALQQAKIYRNRMVMELRGNIEVREPLKEGRKKETRSASIEAQSTLDFEEHFAKPDSLGLVQTSLRFFHEAKVENTVANSGSSLQLADELKQVVARYRDNELQLFSPSGPLSPAEIDLLKMPCNTLAIHELLPVKPVQLNEKWTVPAASLQRLLSLDAIHKSDFTAFAKTHQGNRVDIEFRGELAATANSVPTAIEVEGNMQLDLAALSISWVALVLKEKREISQSEPGFDITARIRLVRQPQSEAKYTNDLSVAVVDEAKLSGLLMQRIESTRGRYSMLADRNWKVIHDNGQAAILRMIENDRVISQCNVHQVAKLDAGQQITLEAFQDEVRKSLDKGFESFASSEERVTETGLRVLQITAIGQASELPVQWIFYHLSDDSGRRLSMVFTVGGELADKLAGTDAQMASSFRFLELPAESSQEPTPAKKPEAEVSSLPTPAKKSSVK
jgi:hypothetical protein